MRKQIITLVLGCWIRPVWAQDSPTGREPNQAIELGSLSYASNVVDGFLVVVIDHDNTLQGQAPSGEFGLVQPLETLVFRDDGQFPDGLAGDFQYVALSPIPETVQGRTQFRTTRADGSVIWDDVIPMPWEKKLPWVALELFAESPVKSTVMTNDFEDEYGGWPDQRGDGAGEMDPSQMSSGSMDDNTGAMGATSDGTKGFGASLGVLLMALLGLPLVAWAATFRRVRARQLQPVGEPKAVDIDGQEPTNIWVLADERQRLDCMVYLARNRHREGRVLLCPQAKSRDDLSMALRGISGVMWSQLDCPSADQLWTMSEELRGWGRPLILVEGPHALEPPDDGEAVDIVLKELMKLRDGQMDVLILVTNAETTGDLVTRVLSPQDLMSLGLIDGDQLD